VTDTVMVRVSARLARWSFALEQLGKAQVRLRQLGRRAPAYEFLVQCTLEDIADALVVIEDEISDSIVEVENTNAR